MVCADRRYAVPLAVFLASLVTSQDDPDRLRIVVLDMGLGWNNRRLLRAGAPSLDIRFVAIDRLVPHTLPTREHLGRAAYGRLFGVDVLAEEAAKILYLDVDTLVLRDLGPLFERDFDEVIAAVQSPAAPFICAGLSTWRALRLPPDTPFMNSGVFVVNTERWRRERITERCLAYLAAYAEYVDFADQDALNAVVAGRFRRLELRWNAISPLRTSGRKGKALAYALFAEEEVDEALQAPSVVHFIGALKPWHRGCPDPATRLWWDFVPATRYRHVVPAPVLLRDKVRRPGAHVRSLLGTQFPGAVYGSRGLLGGGR